MICSVSVSFIINVETIVVIIINNNISINNININIINDISLFDVEKYKWLYKGTNQ